MNFTVFKEFKFCAAHHLNIFGHPCSVVHGHNYSVRIEVSGKRDENGMVIDFHKIRDVVGPLVEKLDHSMLNDYVSDTTAEGLCLWFFNQLGSSLPGLSKIEVRETETCGAFISLSSSSSAKP